MRPFNTMIMLTISSLLAVFVIGCATAPTGEKTGTISEIKSDVEKAFKGTFTVDTYMKKHKPRTIAVLPFVDKSRSQKGNEIVRRGFYNHFSSLPYKDMELFRVNHLLRKAGLYDPDALSSIQPDKLKEILNVDAVVFGTISNFDKIFAGIYSQVSVGAEIKMYDTEGHFLWSGQHVVRVHEGGLPISPIGLISSIISAAMNIRDVQLLRACDDLFRDMIKTIPVIKLAKAHRPPTISLLAQDSKGLPKKAGDEIRVFLKGTPGMLSWFDIGEFKKGVDMKEIEPGGYVGTYRVIPGDNIEDAIVVGYLSDDTGSTASWVDALGAITLDTIPPETPKNATATGRENSVALTWDENKENDLSGYVIYGSETPLSGFQKIEQTEFTNFEDNRATNLKTYYYRISAVDRAGNESIDKLAVMGTAVPPGPTHVSGNIERDLVWYSGASPYIIDDTVVVTENATLTIEPGTIIRSNGSGLAIRGNIIASGGKKQIITFESNIEGTWEGITFERVKGGKSTIEFTRIKDADIGVACKSSSPGIRNNEFAKNNVGLQIFGGYSKPDIESNIIHDNRSTGIIILDGAEPSIKNNVIKNNDRQGLFINNAGAVQVKNNAIVNNRSTGVVVKNSRIIFAGNNIYDNHPFDMEGAFQGKAVDANDNWWGDSDWHEVLKITNGRIRIESILDKPYPEGKSIRIPVLKRVLGGDINEDSILSLSNSPYRMPKDLTIDKGATLNLQSGVKILFDKQTSIIVKDGGIIARGTKDNPIIFTASSSSPSPGDYMSAVRFIKQTGTSSFFKYCKFEYATIAIDVQYGMPEIVYSDITNNSQSGIRCGNDAAPRILYNTITKNLCNGGIECVGLAKPKINYNHFSDNAVAIQAFSTIYIDARHNFWGKAPPDRRVIFGDNINIEPWLDVREKDAFCVSCE